jgi:putative transposase
VTQDDEEQRRRAERARQAGLFRYGLIQDVIDPLLSAAQRGALVRELAGREHDGPSGARTRVSEQTIRRWIRAWRAGGFQALVPAPARVTPRTPAEVLALAVALKRENPRRTAVQVTRILRAQAGWAPSDRTLQRHFARLELDREIEGVPQVFGRFEASRCNEIWTGDALHGPVITGRKTYLFASASARTPSGSPPRCARHWPPAASPARSTWTTGRRSWTPGCCEHARAWVSSSCTRPPAVPRGGGRSSGSCAPRGALSYPRHSREELGGRFLGLMAYPMPKGLWGQEHAS